MHWIEFDYLLWRDGERRVYRVRAWVDDEPYVEALEDWISNWMAWGHVLVECSCAGIVTGYLLAPQHKLQMTFDDSPEQMEMFA